MVSSDLLLKIRKKLADSWKTTWTTSDNLGEWQDWARRQSKAIDGAIPVIEAAAITMKEYEQQITDFKKCIAEKDSLIAKQVDAIVVLSKKIKKTVV